VTRARAIPSGRIMERSSSALRRPIVQCLETSGRMLPRGGEDDNRFRL
jgi:hypothetical protein